MVLRQLNFLEQFTALHQGNYWLEHLISEVFGFYTLHEYLPNGAVYFRLVLVAEQLYYSMLLVSHAPNRLGWVLVHIIEQTIQ